MPADISDVFDALTSLSNTIIATYPGQTDGLFSDQWGWPAPAINRRQAAAYISRLAEDLKQVSSYPSEATISADEVVKRITHLQSQTVPQMYNGNIGQAYPAFVNTLQALRDVLLPQTGWVVPD
jgi:hypothetical protein